jgi:hypothetical protein
MRTSTGFTLVETLAALLVGSLLVFLAQRIFAGIADAAAAVSRARQGSDRAANGRRGLNRLFGSVLSGSPSTVFDGARDQVTLSAWWSDERGWSVRRRCRVVLEGSQLVVDGLESEPVLLADSVDGVAIEYLPARGARAPWLTRFQSQLLLPQAVRMRLARGERVDTLLFYLGVRE